MINFTVGPVQSNDEVKKIGAENVPYFRTTEFSDLMLETEKLVLKFAHAPEDARCVFITGSGTASMEAAVMNTLNEKDKALVIDGGSFGHRFVELLELHGIPYEAIKMQTGQQITREMLLKYDGKGFTAFLVNMHETSTGILYDKEVISDFCKKNSLFLIVDAISSFLADELDMQKMGADVMIAGSQKALACPPGVSLLVLSTGAINRAWSNKCPCMYLNLQLALDNMKRGQTPFTPAVGILLQIHARLRQIEQNGGESTEIDNTRRRAEYFREKIKLFPFQIVPESCSNAVTALKTDRENAQTIFSLLKDEYHIWICPNGGELKDTVFRVGHIGELSFAEYDILLSALKDIQNKGLL